MRIERCVITARQQPGGIEHDLSVTHTIAYERNPRLVVGALVSPPRIVRVGAAARIV
jgi:hypothetical protein